MFIAQQKKACHQNDVRITWAIHPVAELIKPVTQSEIIACYNICDPIRRKFWKAQEQAEHDILRKNIEKELKYCTPIVDPIKEALAKVQNDLYYWITVTPGSDVPLGTKNKPLDVSDFATYIAKYVKRQCWHSAIGCIEQKRAHKSDMRSLHPHAHILIRRKLTGCSKKVIKDNTFSHFKKLYKEKPTPETLKIVPCPHYFVKDKLQYMTTGGKTGDGKAVVQQEDVRWRKEWGFPTFWLNGNIEPE